MSCATVRSCCKYTEVLSEHHRFAGKALTYRYTVSEPDVLVFTQSATLERSRAAVKQLTTQLASTTLRSGQGPVPGQTYVTPTLSYSQSVGMSTEQQQQQAAQPTVLNTAQLSSRLRYHEKTLEQVQINGANTATQVDQLIVTAE